MIVFLPLIILQQSVKTYASDRSGSQSIAHFSCVLGVFYSMWMHQWKKCRLLHACQCGGSYSGIISTFSNSNRLVFYPEEVCFLKYWRTWRKVLQLWACNFISLNFYKTIYKICLWCIFHLNLNTTFLSSPWRNIFCCHAVMFVQYIKGLLFCLTIFLKEITHQLHQHI